MGEVTEHPIATLVEMADELESAKIESGVISTKNVWRLDLVFRMREAIVKIAALEAELAARDAKIAESERELAALRDVISAGDVDFPLWCRIQYAVKGDETFSRAKCTDAVEHISRELAALRAKLDELEGDPILTDDECARALDMIDRAGWSRCIAAHRAQHTAPIRAKLDEAVGLLRRFSDAWVQFVNSDRGLMSEGPLGMVAGDVRQFLAAHPRQGTAQKGAEDE